MSEERVTIRRLTGNAVLSKKPVVLPVWRVSLDGVEVGVIMENDPIKGRVSFIRAISDADKEFVMDSVSENLGVDKVSSLSIPIMPEPEEQHDYGDF